MSGDLSHPGALLAFTADMRGVNIAVDLMAKDLMAMDIMATAARRRQGHSPVRRRPSSNSRRKRSPATPTRRSASKPGRPRTVTKHNQQNKIEIAKKGIRFGSLSHLLQLVSPARRGGCLACERLSKNAALHERNCDGNVGVIPGRCHLPTRPKVLGVA